jgi:hypothetical protein
MTFPKLLEVPMTRQHLNAGHRDRRPGISLRTEFRLATKASIVFCVDTVRAGTFRAPHQARPGRAVLIVADLAVLHGPATGTVELPLSLCWDRPDRRFDLDDPDMRAWAYEIVLREASQPGDLLAYLNRDTLIAVWPHLWLPKGVRRAWEEQHPVLRAAVAA